MTTNKPNGRGTFFYSRKQKVLRTTEENNSIVTVKLDSGIITEYTEMVSDENADGSYKTLEGSVIRPYLERFSDGAILGNGVIYSVNGVVQDYESNLNDKD